MEPIKTITYNNADILLLNSDYSIIAPNTSISDINNRRALVTKEYVDELYVDIDLNNKRDLDNGIFDVKIIANKELDVLGKLTCKSEVSVGSFENRKGVKVFGTSYFADVKLNNKQDGGWGTLEVGSLKTNKTLDTQGNSAKLGDTIVNKLTGGNLDVGTIKSQKINANGTIQGVENISIKNEKDDGVSTYKAVELKNEHSYFRDMHGDEHIELRYDSDAPFSVNTLRNIHSQTDVTCGQSVSNPEHKLSEKRNLNDGVFDQCDITIERSDNSAKGLNLTASQIKGGTQVFLYKDYEKKDNEIDPASIALTPEYGNISAKGKLKIWDNTTLGEHVKTASKYNPSDIDDFKEVDVFNVKGYEKPNGECKNLTLETQKLNNKNGSNVGIYGLGDIGLEARFGEYLWKVTSDQYEYEDNTGGYNSDSSGTNVQRYPNGYNKDDIAYVPKNDLIRVTSGGFNQALYDKILNFSENGWFDPERRTEPALAPIYNEVPKGITESTGMSVECRYAGILPGNVYIKNLVLEEDSHSINDLTFGGIRKEIIGYDDNETNPDPIYKKYKYTDYVKEYVTPGGKFYNEIEFKPYEVNAIIRLNGNADFKQLKCDFTKIGTSAEPYVIKETELGNLYIGKSVDGTDPMILIGTNTYATNQDIDNLDNVNVDANIFETIVDNNGYEYVDLGLTSGTLWATCNVGATNPEDYGDYFAWGETIPRQANADGDTIYNWITYKYCNGSSSTLTKYCNDANYGNEGYTDDLVTIEAADDAATANWGGDWRMPTIAEQNELRTECTWTWTTLNGVNGYEVKGTNGNSIFLPAAGFRSGSSLRNAGLYGDYWSSLLYSGYSECACGLYFNEGYRYMCDIDRCLGPSVRPVIKSTKIENVKKLISIELLAYYDNNKSSGAINVTNEQDIDTLIETNSSANKHEFVDLGLPSGLKWATCNIGADDEYAVGHYFAWGETKPKAEYTWDNYKHGNYENDALTKYCISEGNGTVDNLTTLELVDDAAHVNWGGKWRMPTYDDVQELIDNCTFERVEDENGNYIYYKGTSKNNGNTIILSHIGGYLDGDSNGDSNYMYYWTSTLESNGYAYIIEYSSSDAIETNNYNRYYGMPIRPVAEISDISFNGNNRVINFNSLLYYDTKKRNINNGIFNTNISIENDNLNLTVNISSNTGNISTKGKTKLWLNVTIGDGVIGYDDGYYEPKELGEGDDVFNVKGYEKSSGELSVISNNKINSEIESGSLDKRFTQYYAKDIFGTKSGNFSFENLSIHNATTQTFYIKKNDLIRVTPGGFNKNFFDELYGDVYNYESIFTNYFNVDDFINNQGKNFFKSLSIDHDFSYNTSDFYDQLSKIWDSGKKLTNLDGPIRYALNETSEDSTLLRYYGIIPGEVFIKNLRMERKAVSTGGIIFGKYKSSLGYELPYEKNASIENNGNAKFKELECSPYLKIKRGDNSIKFDVSSGNGGSLCITNLDHIGLLPSSENVNSLFININEYNGYTYVNDAKYYSKNSVIINNGNVSASSSLFENKIIYGFNLNHNSDIAIGKYNSSSDQYQFVIGNGTSSLNRKNILAIDKSNNLLVPGDLVCGENPDTAKHKLSEKANDNEVIFVEDEITKFKLDGAYTVISGSDTFYSFTVIAPKVFYNSAFVNVEINNLDVLFNYIIDNALTIKFISNNASDVFTNNTVYIPNSYHYINNEFLIGLSLMSIDDNNSVKLVTYLVKLPKSLLELNTYKITWKDKEGNIYQLPE